MLILNNGAPKSGSTWMQTILREALTPEFPESQWRNDWKNPSVDPARLGAFIASSDWHVNDVLVKLHVPASKDMAFLQRDDVRVIVTVRHTPDSVLSWFHHQIRLGKASLNKKQQWFETTGLRFADRIRAHRLSWVLEPRAIHIRYEDLLTHPVRELQDIMAHLGKHISIDSLQQVVNRTMVKRAPNEPPHEGQHIRTAGISVADKEIPPEILQHLKTHDFETETQIRALRSGRG